MLPAEASVIGRYMYGLTGCFKAAVDAGNVHSVHLACMHESAWLQDARDKAYLIVRLLAKKQCISVHP